MSLPRPPMLLILLAFARMFCATCATAASAEFFFTTNNGAITFHDYRSNDPVLPIPRILNGLPVGSIEYLDSDWETFRTLWHPELTTINIPDTVTNIAYGALGSGISGECKSLAEINVDGANPRFSSVNGVLFNKDKTALYIFPPRNPVRSYTVPSSVTRIDKYAFYGCINLTNITLGTNVCTIGSAAFSGCDNLENMFVPAGVTNIGEGAFVDCSFIDVDDSNAAYCSADGVLFDKRRTILIRFPAKKVTDRYTIPDSVTKIARGAFFNQCHLTNVIFGKQLAQIEDRAFLDCANLSTIVIPESVRAIGESAFKGCHNLTRVIIPESVTDIGAFALSQCTSLTNMILGSRVSSIGSYAFAKCINLTSVKISEGVTNFGTNVFWGCQKLSRSGAK